MRLSTLLSISALGLVAIGAGVWRDQLRPQPAAVDVDVSVDEDVERAAMLLALAASWAEHPHSDEVVQTVDRGFGLQVSSTARGQLRAPMSGFRDDCSGYVSAVMTAEGLDMDGRVITIYERAVDNDAIHWDLEPIAGDLIFFDDTHDRNRNGRLDDDLTHIAIVLDVEPDGTVVFGHAGLSSGRGVGRMNLYTPGQRRNADGEPINSVLRSATRYEPEGTVHLAGELFAGFARVDPALDWTTEP